MTATAVAVADRVSNMEPEDQEALLTKLLTLQATNPAAIGFPAMLPVELAMAVDTPKNICAAYNLTREQFTQIIQHPVFVKAYQEAIEMLKVDGMSFKVKAKLQSEEYLGTAYAMVKNPNISDAVRADLIKNTVRWAGLDAKAVDVANGGNSFNIQINLGG